MPQLLQVVEGVNVAFIAFGNSYSGMSLDPLIQHDSTANTSLQHNCVCFISWLILVTGKSFTLEGSGSGNDAVISMCVSGLFHLLSDKQGRSSSRRRSANARITTSITMQLVLSLSCNLFAATPIPLIDHGTSPPPLRLTPPPFHTDTLKLPTKLLPTCCRPAPCSSCCRPDQLTASALRTRLRRKSTAKPISLPSSASACANVAAPSHPTLLFSRTMPSLYSFL